MLDILIAISIENTNPAIVPPKSSNAPSKVVKEFIPPDKPPPQRGTYGSLVKNQDRTSHTIGKME